MNWIEAKIVFDSSDPLFIMDLISNIFYDFGLQGVVIEAPEEAEEKPKHYAVIGYIPEDKAIDTRCRILESELSRLKQELGVHYKILYKKTTEKDWAESWKAFFKPEKISERLVVKPTWQAYRSQTGEIVLEIDPGMAFGTGTHPTTTLCLQMIETYLKPGVTVLDVGIGSGILMVAAARLGAGRILGIDIDPSAVEIARNNLLLNGVTLDRFRVRAGHLIRDVKERFQLVMANILTETIIELLDDLKTVLADDGVFVLSGITKENTQKVLNKIHSNGLSLLEIRYKEEWVAIAGM